MIFSRLARLFFSIALITASASTFAITLLCTPESLSGWNTARENKGQQFPDTCSEYRKLYPKNIGCYPVIFEYEPTSDFARVNQTMYKLLSSTPYEYEFREVGVSGFINDAPLNTVIFEAKIKVDRRSLDYTYTHGTAVRYAPNQTNSNLMLESGTCKVFEEEKEETIF